jgi:hypothetical protein
MAKYTPDHRSTGQWLRNDPTLRALLYRRAALGLSTAAALAPRRTGKLAASGRVIDMGSHGGANHDRMEFQIRFDVGYAVPATFPKRNPTARDYLRAAVSVIEAG